MSIKSNIFLGLGTILTILISYVLYAFVGAGELKGIVIGFLFFALLEMLVILIYRNFLLNLEIQNGP